MAKPKSKSFKEAFAEARKAGDKTFMFGGKKYTTELKEEAAKKPAPAKPKVDFIPVHISYFFTLQTL